MSSSSSIKAIAEPPKHLYPWQRPESGTTTIGVVDPCYGSSHVIFGLNTTRYKHRTLVTLPLKRLDKNTTFFRYTPFILDFNTPLVHMWNSIPFNRDYIVSFELELPRYLGSPGDDQIRRGMALLESERCRGIFALSEFASTFAAKRFEKYGFDHLKEKLDVFRGAIPNIQISQEIEEMRDKHRDFSEKPFSAVVIGTQLFRKGGMYAIKAFEKLRASGLNVSLTLIGDFEANSYAFGDAIPNAAEWRVRAKQHEWIRIMGAIPYAQVFDELLAHDLCVYTSLDESLGWLPIEAGLLGIPVLGAKVCAFPELIVDRETGCLIDMPVYENGRWTGLGLTGKDNQKAHEDASNRIVSGIVECVTAAYEKPELLSQWGNNAKQRLSQLYGIEQASRRLETIYDTALNVL